MTFRQFAISGCLAAAVAFLPGASRADTPTKTATQEHREISRLLREVAVDARQVHMHARRLELLSQQGKAPVATYDTHWNDLKPKVDDMSAKLEKLQTMRASALPWQQQAIDKSASLIKEIQTDTQNVKTFLNDHPKDLSNSTLKGYEETLAKGAMQLAMAARRPMMSSMHGRQGRPMSMNRSH